MATSLTRLRFQKLTQSKKGRVSISLLILVLLISLFADFIANDKPIFIRYDGKSYFPIFTIYAETEFGGDFETEPDYKDPFVKNLINNKGFYVMPPIKYSYDTINFNLGSPPPTAPDYENLLGTDDLGRDVLARLIYGVRISLAFGIILTILSSIVGVLLGAVQGFYGGLFDLIMQRFIEIWSNMPTLFILIILSAIITPNFFWLLMILFAFSWMSLVQPVRAEFLKNRKLEYIKAARASGVTESSIIFKHLLPNALVSTLAFLPFILSGSIITLTSLDFLGFGMPAGSASLGELLAQGKNNISAYWIGLTGFFVTGFLLTILIFVGEAVRDSFR
ncbi:MAG: ABC transporter permease [Rickettsiales bacterium]|jgi:microcin C transport system permease protein|nr:ABC transporter permease [Rickettsiales bacterium]